MMSKHEIGCLKHCPGGGGGEGGGPLAAVLLIILAITAAGAYHIRKGIETGVHVAFDVLEVLLIVILVSAGAALLAGAAYVAVRVYRSVQRGRARQETVAAPHMVVRLGPPEERGTAIGSHAPAALENTHVHDGFRSGEWTRTADREGRKS